MVDAVNSIGGVNGAEAAIQRTPAVKAEAVAEPVGKAVETPTPISPRLVFDPGAGAMVTEFVSQDGEITAQVPSAAALAYLRAGLNANGQQEADAAFA